MNSEHLLIQTLGNVEIICIRKFAIESGADPVSTEWKAKFGQISKRLNYQMSNYQTDYH